MDAPGAKLYVPRIQFIGCAFLNHEVGCIGGSWNRTEAHWFAEREQRALGPAHFAGEGERRCHDAAENAVHVERPFILAKFDGDRRISAFWVRGRRGEVAQGGQRSFVAAWQLFCRLPAIGAQIKADSAFSGLLHDQDAGRASLAPGGGELNVAFIAAALYDGIPAAGGSMQESTGDQHECEPPAPVGQYGKRGMHEQEN